MTPAVVTAILAVGGIGVIGIVQTLKKWLKIGGAVALVLTFAVSLGATAIILVQAQAFTWVALVIYGLIVFGEASGLYHVLGPKPVV